MVLSNLTRPEINNLLSNCNFSEREEEFFLLRTSNATLEDCIDIMHLSPSTIDRLSKRVKGKIKKVLL